MNTDVPRPVKGLRFTHRNRRVECYVVRVTKVGVYYRVAGGHGGGNVNIKTWPDLYSPLEKTSGKG